MKEEERKMVIFINIYSQRVSFLERSKRQTEAKNDIMELESWERGR